MKILMPLWYLDVLNRSFVFPLTKSISKHLGSQPHSFHMAYVEGKPQQEWKKHFSFHKLDIPCGSVKAKMARFYLSRRKIYNQIKDIDTDVIFTLSDLWAQEFSRHCSKKMNIPYAVRLRGNPKEVRKAIKASWIKEKILNYLDVKSLKQTDLVIPNSKDLAKKAEEWGVEKAKITREVHNGVDTRMFRPMQLDRSKKFTVAYGGRISQEKRVPYLFRIAERKPNIHFLVAGKVQMDIAFPSSVEYVGSLPFSDMPEFYNKADIIILPSATEGFPNTILEAYACGKPVLVAKEAFPKELRVFGSVADINEFGLEIENMRSADMEAMGKQARNYVEKNYTWNKFGKSIIEYLKKVVG